MRVSWALPVLLFAAQPLAAETVPGPKFAEVYAEVAEVFGGEAGLQQAYENGRRQEALMLGTIALTPALANSVRSSRPDIAENLEKAAVEMTTSHRNLKQALDGFEDLVTPLDDAKARAAYAAAYAPFAEALTKPEAEQARAARNSPPLDSDAAQSALLAFSTLVTVAKRP